MSIQVFDPTGQAPESETSPSGLAERSARLSSAGIALLDNLKPPARPLLSAFARRFRAESNLAISYWEKTGPLGSAGPIEFAESLAESSGAVLNALGD